MTFELPPGLDPQNQMLWCMGVAARLDTAVEAGLRDMGRFLAHYSGAREEISDIWGGIGSDRGLLTELQRRLDTDRVSDAQRAAWHAILERADLAHQERNRLIHDDWWPLVVQPSGHPAIWHRRRRVKANGTPFPSENYRTIESFLDCVNTLEDVWTEVEGQFQSTAMSIDLDGYKTWWAGYTDSRREWPAER